MVANTHIAKRMNNADITHLLKYKWDLRKKNTKISSNKLNQQIYEK